MKPLPVIGWLALLIPASVSLAGPVDFARDIKPLLNKHCTACHGGVKQASNLSLVYHSKVLEPAKSGKIPVVPGNLDKSELIARITTTDDDEVMPPPKHGKRLPEHDIQLFKDWISQGAPWDEHWAFVKPKPPTLPDLKDKSWPKQSLDAFVLAKLESEGLKPSPEADRAQWLRRVSLDLTGLPPTPEEVSSLRIRHSSQSLIACCAHPPSASAGPACGSISRAMPTPKATKPTSRASSGHIATG